MALAWNAGWVNSPRGFKSRILRSRSCRPRADMHDIWLVIGLAAFRLA
jgi:hypothetical protein